MLLANVGGSTTARPRLMTVAGSRTSRAVAAQSQDRQSPNAVTRATAAITPGAPPPGR